MAFSPTTIATQTSVNTARDLYETKQRAAKYYDCNGVPKKMEEILNSMFYENPEDVYGHLANFFEQYARLPTISKINARIALDSKGHSTLQTEVYCTVKNKVKLCCTSVCCNPNSNLPENAKAEDTEPEEEAREIGVHEAQALVESEISKRLCGQDPSHQRSIDEIISNLYLELKTAEEERLAKEAEEKGGEETSRDDASSQASGKKGGKASAKGQKKKGKSATVVFAPAEPPEFFLPSCNAVNAVSMAVCSTAASLNNMPLFEHVASLKYNLIPQDLSVPLPMVTILQSGRSMPGKSNCIKEYMVVPKPGMPLSESVPHIQKIYAHVAKGFFAKGGVAARFVNDLGTLCPVLDRPEQGLDLLQEAITSCGLTPGEDFFLAINCAGHELFDYEKGKYEILVGQQKLAEDLVEFWAELIGRYPSIIAVIDPMRKQERDHWMRLSERISDQCFVIGNHAYHRPGLLKNEELTEHFQTSGIVLKLDRVTTISDAMETATKMEEAGNNITVETCYGESTDTILADFAVGIQAKFLKLGAPVRGERVALINRLLQIESQLEIHGRLVHQKAFTFPHLEPPPPPPEPEEGSVEEEPKKDNPAKKK